MSGKAVPMGRYRKEPWLIIDDGSWRTEVLKAYSIDPDAQYARWLCRVITPYTGPLGDMGDTYTADVRGWIIFQDPAVPDSALPRHLRGREAKSVTQVRPGLTVIEVKVP